MHSNRNSFFAIVAMFVVCIIFIWIAWISKIDFIINTGFLVLGALLAVVTSFVSEGRQRGLRAQDRARVLHIELADLVARCCFDSEEPWRRYWDQNIPDEVFNVIRLRKFTPNVATIFSASAGELALLRGDAPLLLVQFQYRLNALRREIENIADDSSEATRVEPISKAALKLVGLRFRQALTAGLNALAAFEGIVPNAEQAEASAIQQYDLTRNGPAPPGTLRERIRTLLQVPYH